PPVRRLADRLGITRADGGGRDRPSGGGAGRRLARRASGRGRLLAGGPLHRRRLPARLLPALPRLLEVLPAVGAGPLPQPEAQQRAARGARDVCLPAWPPRSRNTPCSRTSAASSSAPRRTWRGPGCG